MSRRSPSCSCAKIHASGLGRTHPLQVCRDRRYRCPDGRRQGYCRGHGETHQRQSPCPSTPTALARLKLEGRVVVYLDAEFTVDQLTRWVKPL
jgi:hypothetical protein